MSDTKINLNTDAGAMGVIPPSPQGNHSSVAGAERELDKLSKYAGLTTAGRRWVTAALDPFHDSALEVDGFPDYEQINTITQPVKRSINITAPPNLLPQALWDCHIFSTPLLTTFNGSNFAFTNGCVKNLPIIDNRGGQLGTLTIVTVEAGRQTFAKADGTIPPPNGGPAPAKTYGLSPVAQESTLGIPLGTYCEGKHRLIGAGFEVVNATAALFKGGTVTVYQQNQRCTDGINHEYDRATSLWNVGKPSALAKNYHGPPPDISSAMLLPDTRQWPAAEGCYVALRGIGSGLEFIQPIEQEFQLSAHGLYNIGSTAGGAGGAATSRQNVSQFVSGEAIPLGTYAGDPGGPAQGMSWAKSFHPFNQSGAYFTGLHSATALTVNGRFIMERAPDATEEDLIVLARPSPPEDPLALAIYSEAVRLMPPGVRLKDNGLGTWFKQAVGNVAKAVLPIAKQHGPDALGFLLQQGGASSSNAYAAQSLSRDLLNRPSPIQSIARSAKQSIQAHERDLQRDVDISRDPKVSKAVRARAKERARKEIARLNRELEGLGMD